MKEEGRMSQREPGKGSWGGSHLREGYWEGSLGKATFDPRLESSELLDVWCGIREFPRTWSSTAAWLDFGAMPPTLADELGQRDKVWSEMGLLWMGVQREPDLWRIKNHSLVLTLGMVAYFSHQLPHGGVEKGSPVSRGSPESASWHLGLL